MNGLTSAIATRSLLEMGLKKKEPCQEVECGPGKCGIDFTNLYANAFPKIRISNDEIRKEGQRLNK
jgi:hypothetical protein